MAASHTDDNPTDHSVAQAAMTPPPPRPHVHAMGDSTVHPLVHPVDPKHRDRALSLLLTGRPKAPGRVLRRFADFVAQQGLNTDALWAIHAQGQPVATALLVPSPGRAAMLFLSPGQPSASETAVLLDLTNGGGAKRQGAASTEANTPKATHRPPTPDVLVQAVCQAADPERITLVQALLDPNQQNERHWLMQAGFFDLAALSYMQRPIGPAAWGQPLPAAPTASVASIEKGLLNTLADTQAISVAGGGADAKLLPWKEGHRGLFEQAIADSYVDTLDCPGLVGLRSMDEILAGHMGAGVFDPSLWRVLLDASDNPVAVLLLAEVPANGSMELVYLGLSPSIRGQGIGRQLVALAIAQAEDRRVDALHLAVDQTNAPALGLYRRMGFSAHAHKLALTWSLKQPADVRPQSP